MCLVPLMHQILWLTSETSMKIALFSNFECHRVPAWVRYPPQPITCCARARNYTLDMNIPHFTYRINIP